MSDFAAKRRHPRTPSMEAVRIVSAMGVEYATLEDVSVSGVRLRSDHPVSANTILEIEFDVPTQLLKSDAPLAGTSVKAMARVTRSTKILTQSQQWVYSIGLQFLEPIHQKLSRLDQKWIDEEGGPF